jgi:hypothetical protein
LHFGNIGTPHGRTTHAHSAACGRHQRPADGAPAVGRAERCGGLAVAREVRPWQAGRCLVFDDSFIHEAINQSDETRVVLIFDLRHPALTGPEREALAAGIAAIGDLIRRVGAGAWGTGAQAYGAAPEGRHKPLALQTFPGHWPRSCALSRPP